MSKLLRKISRNIGKEDHAVIHSKMLEAYNLGKDMGRVQGQELGAKRQQEQDNELLNKWFDQLKTVPGVGEKLSERILDNFNKFLGGKG